MWDPFKTSNVRVSIVDALRVQIKKSKTRIFFIENKKNLTF